MTTKSLVIDLKATVCAENVTNQILEDDDVKIATQSEKYKDRSSKEDYSSDEFDEDEEEINKEENTEFTKQLQEAEEYNKNLSDSIKYPDLTKKKHSGAVYHSRLLPTREITRILGNSKEVELEISAEIDQLNIFEKKVSVEQKQVESEIQPHLLGQDYSFTKIKNSELIDLKKELDSVKQELTSLKQRVAELENQQQSEQQPLQIQPAYGTPGSSNSNK
ncbi:5226_t:CDS:2 [Scutellospora calospora]|uniref:5226_t:CDS:1 n=1 Tax=Scutellospora calospora TaxID=85575 RepID=A0ACA9KLC5_9GLOM|nr:5226_t:CDS:2 [Scutellospora calospora]